MRYVAGLLLCLALAAPVRADAADERPQPGSAYMIGLEIHTPSGRLVHVPLPARRADDTTVYGRIAEGWLVRVRCGVFRVRGGEATRLRKTRPCGSQGNHTEMLGDDRRHFLLTDDQQGAGIQLQSVDLQERRRRSVYIDEGYDIRAAAGGRAYVETYGSLVQVDLATGETEVLARRRPAAVDLDTDTVFLESPRGSHWYGPTVLSDPGPVRWRKRFRPVVVSPGGSYVLGDEVGADGDPGRLEVRRTRDGALVRRFARPSDDGDFPVVGFGADDSVVLVVTVGDRQALVRCGLPRDRCARVMRPTRLAVSLPTSVVGPDRNHP